MIVIAFCFLLRVGEYTPTTRRKKKTRTRQFQKMDVSFFVRTNTGMLRLLPCTATAVEIIVVDAATLRISNQKNGIGGVCVHHWAVCVCSKNGHRKTRTCHNKLAHCAEARQRSLVSLDAGFITI